MEIHFLVTRFLPRLNIHVEYRNIHLVSVQSFPENKVFYCPGTHTYAIWLFPASNPFQQYNDHEYVKTLLFFNFHMLW